MYFPLSVSIPEPCHEDWGKMDPVDINQRHCQSCEKTVTDFTNMSDVQIGNHLRKGGNLCGRFRASQLDRRIAIGEPRRFSGLRAAAAASGLLFSLPTAAQALQVPPPTHIEVTEKTGAEAGKPDQVPSLGKGQVTLTGQIFGADDEEYGLIGASIQLKGTTIGTITDIDGKYAITVPADTAATLIINYTGFARETRTIPVERLQQALLSPDGNTLVEPTLNLSPVLCEEFWTGGISFRRPNPSLLESLMVHTIKPAYVGISHAGQAKYGDWKDYWREKFAKAKARRTERRAERQARKELRLEALSTLSPATGVPTSSKSISPEDPLQLKASPNPFVDNIKLEFQLPKEQDYTLELLSSAGKLITSQSGEGVSGAQQIELQHGLAKLPSGTYFLRLRTEDGLFSVTTVVR